ncbi:MAG: hypothetical protein GY706_01630, partial [Bacteroides sp.]|nr:hypothetical protein [Bacteroides sp.]
MPKKIDSGCTYDKPYWNDLTKRCLKYRPHNYVPCPEERPYRNEDGECVKHVSGDAKLFYQSLTRKQQKVLRKFTDKNRPKVYRPEKKYVIKDDAGRSHPNFHKDLIADNDETKQYSDTLENRFRAVCDAIDIKPPESLEELKEFCRVTKIKDMTFDRAEVKDGPMIVMIPSDEGLIQYTRARDMYLHD